MPKTSVVFYCEENGSVPVLEWLDQLPTKAQDKCMVKIRRLSELGHELRRPEADILQDGIRELRIGLHHINYRILYFFHGGVAAILAHGLTKEDRIPKAAIEVALSRKREFERAPAIHSYEDKGSL